MIAQTFERNRRLLTAADYQPVFQQAQLRVSQQHLLLLARYNQQPQPRLGVVVAKKHIRLAVSRNRIKRVARNSFRLSQQQLAGLDIIFLARSGLDKLPPAKQSAIIASAFSKLARKLADDQSSPQAGADG